MGCFKTHLEEESSLLKNTSMHAIQEFHIVTAQSKIPLLYWVLSSFLGIYE